MTLMDSLCVGRLSKHKSVECVRKKSSVYSCGVAGLKPRQNGRNFAKDTFYGIS